MAYISGTLCLSVFQYCLKTSATRKILTVFSSTLQKSTWVLLVFAFCFLSHYHSFLIIVLNFLVHFPQVFTSLPRNFYKNNQTKSFLTEENNSARLHLQISSPEKNIFLHACVCAFPSYLSIHLCALCWT